MITNALITLLGIFIDGITSAFFALVPMPPGWFSSALAEVQVVFQWLHTLDHWVPVSLTLTVAAAVVATYLVTLAMEIVRMIASYLTLGGGAK